MHQVYDVHLLRDKAKKCFLHNAEHHHQDNAKECLLLKLKNVMRPLQKCLHAILLQTTLNKRI